MHKSVRRAVYPQLSPGVHAPIRRLPQVRVAENERTGHGSCTTCRRHTGVYPVSGGIGLGPRVAFPFCIYTHPWRPRSTLAFHQSVHHRDSFVLSALDFDIEIRHAKTAFGTTCVHD